MLKSSFGLILSRMRGYNTPFYSCYMVIAKSIYEPSSVRDVEIRFRFDTFRNVHYKK